MLKEQGKNYTDGLEHHTYTVVTTTCSFMLRQSSDLPKHETTSK